MSRRRLILNVVSLVLLAAVLGLWRRSHRRADLAALFTPGGTAQVLASHRGSLYLFLSDIPSREERRSTVDFDSADADIFDSVPRMLDKSSSARRQLAGFGFNLGTPGALGSPGKGFLLLIFPHWLPALLLAAYPARTWWLRRRANRWAKAGRCAACGYDLRGTAVASTPDTQATRCPECGEDGWR